MGATIDLHLPSVVVGGKNVTYYLALSAVLFLGWAWQSRKPDLRVDAPLYKTSKLKWYFDAETQIINSYNKVWWRPWNLEMHHGARVLHGGA